MNLNMQKHSSDLRKLNAGRPRFGESSLIWRRKKKTEYKANAEIEINNSQIKRSTYEIEQRERMPRKWWNHMNSIIIINFCKKKYSSVILHYTQNRKQISWIWNTWVLGSKPGSDTICNIPSINNTLEKILINQKKHKQRVCYDCKDILLIMQITISQAKVYEKLNQIYLLESRGNILGESTPPNHRRQQINGLLRSTP